MSSVPLEVVLASVMRSTEVAFRLKEACRNDLVVANPFYLQIMEFVSTFVDDHSALPKTGDYTAWISTLSERQQAGVRNALSTLQATATDDYTPEYLAEHAMGELRLSATRTAVDRLAGLQDIDHATFLKMAERVQEIESLSIEGLANLQEVDRWIEMPREDYGITTGIPTLDGMMRGWGEELAFVLADSGVGKTTTLINFAAAAALHGANVFHLTLELRTQNAANRYYRRISESTQKEFRQDLEGVRGRLQHWWRYAKGGINVLYRPAYEVTPENLRSMLKLYTQQHGPVDMIVVDYLDLMAPSPRHQSHNTYEQLGYVSHLVRNLCEEFHAPVISATQATRNTRSTRRSSLSLGDMGDSYKKVRAADIILGLVQTEEEEEVYQGRFQLLKVRESPGRGLQVPIYINMDLMYIGDLHHPNTQRIAQALGHPVMGVQVEEPEEESAGDESDGTP